jgi:hypothetical protein
VPHDKPEYASVLHIGNILNHYFSVTDPAVVQRLTAEYFTIIESNDDKLLSTH